MTAELMYLVLVGEMQVQSGQAGAGYAMLLEAARQSADPALYQRAVNIALQSRSGDAALTAAKAWSSADKQAVEPLRVMLQIMLSMNRIESSASALEQLLDTTPDAQRNELIDLVGQTYSRVSDHAAALKVVADAMRLWQRNSPNASSAWTALARVQLAAGQDEEGRQSAEKALTAEPSTPAAGLLAIDTFGSAHPISEEQLQRFLTNNPSQQAVRMAYARHLLGTSRWADAENQLKQLTTESPNLAEPWLMLGALQLQDNRLSDAETSMKRFLSLSSTLDTERQERGNTQAYLALAQLAEQRQNYSEAKEWLDRISSTENTLNIQLRRAGLLARSGNLDEARTLIQAIPARQESDVRAKVLADAQLLKEAGRTADAFEVLSQAVAQTPEDTELLYEQAMLAEKLGRFPDMERMLRKVMQISPNNPNAYNALGYSLADRHERLDEAKALIAKALELSPGDPFITDSLGWVEFRLGNMPEAARLLRQAMSARADAEIATHLGEVLWTMGERDAAMTLFQQGLRLQPGNATLLETMRRLGITTDQP
jgi:tetratricopeptide (TPR) repeat protein